MKDAFWESATHDFVESPMRERQEYPGGCGAGIILGYLRGRHVFPDTVTVDPNPSMFHPGGYWRFDLRVTRELGETNDEILIVLGRSNTVRAAGAPFVIEWIDGSGAVYPSNRTLSTQNPFVQKPPVDFPHADVFQVGQPAEQYRSLYNGPPSPAPLGTADLGYPSGGYNHAGWYTWRIGNTGLFEASATVREPTAYCNPQFFILVNRVSFLSSPFQIEVACKRLDRFLVKFVASQIGVNTMRFADASIISNEYNILGAFGGVASRSWDFGDGQSGTGRTPEHTYAAPGTYLVTLTITDVHGAEIRAAEKNVVVV